MTVFVMGCWLNELSNHPAHSASFDERLYLLSNDSVSRRWWLLSDCANAQVDLGFEIHV